MDMDYIRGELTKLGLDEFHENILRTVAVWFDDAQPDEMTDYLTDRLFNNTVFGDRQRALVSEAYRRFCTQKRDWSFPPDGSRDAS